MRSYKDRIRIDPLPASARLPAVSPAARRPEAPGRRRAPRGAGLRGRRRATGRGRPGSRRSRHPRSRDRARRRRGSARRWAGVRGCGPAHPHAHRERRRPGSAGRDEPRRSRCGQPVEDVQGQHREGESRPRTEAQDHRGEETVGPEFGGDVPEDSHFRTPRGRRPGGARSPADPVREQDEDGTSGISPSSGAAATPPRRRAPPRARRRVETRAIRLRPRGTRESGLLPCPPHRARTSPGCGSRSTPPRASPAPRRARRPRWRAPRPS